MVVNSNISIKTNGDCDTTDITDQVKKEMERSGVNSGIVTIFVAGSTAGVTTIEYESGVIRDFAEMWDRNVPNDIRYHHDQRWGDGNGHSHVRASLLGPSLTIPFVNGRLTLGTWQQIIMVDFDNRPRSREIIVQILGE